jgi:ribonucleoside-triphosphate reductase (thioredoxin)
MFVPNIQSQEQFNDIAYLLYKACKAITRMDYLHEETNEVIHRNSRIGIGITGICSSLNKVRAFVPNGYEYLREKDVEWSIIKEYPVSIKRTTIKPSGTLSLLAGVTPGIHAAYAQYYIRRVRMSSDDALVDYCRSQGYHVEFARQFDGTIDYNVSVVSFPCESSHDAILAKDMSAVRQLELVKEMQMLWSDSAVSCTVYYKREELPEIKAWLAENYEHSIKAVSFLLHNDHGFDQAPYEEISKETYTEFQSRLKQSQTVSMSNLSELSDDECAAGACPIR